MVQDETIQQAKVFVLNSELEETSRPYFSTSDRLKTILTGVQQRV